MGERAVELLSLPEGATVLFQGDSVTDVGRDRNNAKDLGPGYPGLVGAWVSALYPEKRLHFLNRGVSGDRVRDLRARWKRDCLELQPALVSILIGVNDTWRRYDSQDPTSVDQFAADYDEILGQVRRHLPDTQIVMMEPFVLPEPADRQQWREDLDPKITAVRLLASRHGALLVPLDGIFAQACTRREPQFWSADGVHPSPAGHALIAQAWLRAVHVL